MRTSLALAVLALALLGYIVLVDRGKLSSSELEQRKGTALPELVRERISKIELQLKGVTTVIERNAGSEGDDALWRVSAPYRGEADQDAVDTLLGELEWLDGRRNLGVVNAADQQRFGLDKPRVRLWFTVGAKRVPLIVGGESARGEGIYVQVGDPAQVMIAGKDLLEGLRQEPGHFHTKSLHDGMLVSTTTSIELRDAAGSRGLGKRSDELWGVLPDMKRLASTEVVQRLVDGLDALRASRFVSDAKGDLARYGLTTPRFVVHVEKTKLASSLASGEAGKAGEGSDPKRAADKPLREPVSFELRVGAACAGHSGESYVLVAGGGKVLCAMDADLDKLRVDAAGLREARLAPFTDDAIESVRVEHAGRTLALTSKDETFAYELTVGGKRAAQGTAREGSVADWLKALAATHATDLDSGVPSAVTGASTLTLTLGRHGGKPPFVVRALAGATALLALRGDEPSVAAFPSSAIELLSPEVARFRPLTVLQLAEPAIRALAIERAAATEPTERIVRSGPAGFRIEAPVSAAADPVLVPELVRLVASLHAERFVADASRPEHGLSSPFARLRIELAGSVESLLIGAETPGGRFAQRAGADPAVFVLGAQLVDLVASPLADRAALATPIERLSEVVVARGAGRARIVRQGEGFIGAEPVDLPQPAARALAETLATLRATRVVGYAAALAGKTFATLEVKATDAAGAATAYTLALGADAGDGARFAYRTGQPAVLVLSKETVERLLAVLPAAAR